MATANTASLNDVILARLRPVSSRGPSPPLPAPSMAGRTFPLMPALYSYFSMRSAAIIPLAVTLGTPPPGCVELPTR